jgi:hypothetical protein
MHRVRWPFVLLCLLAALAGTQAQEPAFSAVVLHRLGTFEGMRFNTALLSPDGSRYAYLGADLSLCVFAIDGTETGCVTLEPVQSLDPQSLRWSADSRYIAMTQNFIRFFIDADIWVLDTETMGLNNVTPDSVDRLNLNDDNWPGYQDMAPVWLADGRLAFVRAQRRNAAFTTTLYSALPDGTDLTPIPGAVFDGLMPYLMSAAAQAPVLAYNVEKLSDGIFGVEVLQLPEGTAAPVLKMNRRLVDMSLSADGRYVVIADERTLLLDEGVGYVAADAEQTEPLTLNAPGIVAAAAIAPDSSAIAYLISEPNNSEINGLYVQPLPEGEPQQVLKGTFRSPLNTQYLLVWGGDTVLLVERQTQELLAIRITGGS